MGRKGAEQSETPLLASAAPASPRVSALPLPVAVVGAVTWERRRGPCSQAPGVTALDSPRTGGDFAHYLVSSIHIFLLENRG